MSKIKLLTKDVYDLSLVIESIVNEQSETLEFKEIIKLQKFALSLKDSIKEFVSSYSDISSKRNSLVEVLKKKLETFKRTKLEELKKSGIVVDFKEKVDQFTEAMTEELQSQLRDEIQPQFDALYKSIGEKEASFEIEDSFKSILVDNFEKFAKTKYNNKSKMIEVYSAITEAK